MDDYFGVRDMADVVAAVGGQWREHLAGERMLTTPRHYAYLKISEGCDRRCGYCAIPLIRGRHVSVPMDALVAEAEKLAAGGTRELIVIAQDTTYYGLDLYGERKLGELLRRLCRIDGIEWVRLHYAYPASFPQDAIDAMRDEPKICKYLDIPFQHISDSQLRSMRRGIDRAQTYALIDRLRSEIPGIALRTTLLTGYPDESEADFAELMEFVRAGPFRAAGRFRLLGRRGDLFGAAPVGQRTRKDQKAARRAAHGTPERHLPRTQHAASRHDRARNRRRPGRRTARRAGRNSTRRRSIPKY